MPVRRAPLLGLDVIAPLSGTGVLSASVTPPLPHVQVFVDTDIGVDDAVAISWLLREPSAEVLGFTTVAGNSSVENATRNLLTLLDAADRRVPVTSGAVAPLVFPASHVGAFVHGPDGLWFAQRPQDLSAIPSDAPAAIAAAARTHPGMTLLALGPLTNIAQAVQRYPDDLAGVHIIALVGARVGGNRTPVAEANAYFDPQALAVVLNSGLNVTLVTLDAFAQLTVDSVEFPRELAQHGGALGQFLAAPLGAYFQAETRGAGGMAPVPDAAVAIYMLRPALGSPASALVDVATDSGLTRGQTVIATDPNMKLTMIADDAQLSALACQALTTPGFDLPAAMGQIMARRPDNATVVPAIDANAMRRALIQGLTR